MKEFQRELAALRRRVLDMGTLAESMAAGASRAVLAADREAGDLVLANEPALDRFQIENDRDAIRLITIYTPVAHDLRALLMIARINSELERIGDQAVDNCEHVELFTPSQRPLDNLSRMSDMVLGMVHDALRAFADEDTMLAQTVMRLDDPVDELNARIFRELLERAAPEPADQARTMALVLVARSLERIADHATNICEEVFYLVEGADIRHATAAERRM